MASRESPPARCPEGQARRGNRLIGWTATLALAAGLSAPALAIDGDDRAADRARMILTIELGVLQTSGLTGRSALDARVMDVMSRLPRHAFVPPELSKYAYLDRPLPVGHGQKVSQPYIVALMTDLARISKHDTVLILGMGGGYHAAIASRLAREVRCVEMFEPVAEAAMRRLVGLDFHNVQVKVGDPYFGWAGLNGGFDSIIVRLAMDDVPRALVNQLKVNGRLVMPLGRAATGQHLVVIEKRAGGGTRQRRILPVRFTRMPGGPRI